MFVSEYATFVNPSSTSITLRNEKKEEKKDFSLKSQQKEIQPLKTPKNLPINYISSTNYYANKYKIQQQLENKEQNFQQENIYKNPVEKFKSLSKLNTLPKAYSVSFTTFSDLLKPKIALSKEYNYGDDKYSKLKELDDKNKFINLYIANDIYYQRISA